MFIIYGTKTLEKNLGNVPQDHSCPRCSNVMTPSLIRYRRFFSLYWIPIFPFSTKYFLACTVCGNHASIPNPMAKELKPMLVKPNVLSSN